MMFMFMKRIWFLLSDERKTCPAPASCPSACGSGMCASYPVVRRKKERSFVPLFPVDPSVSKGDTDGSQFIRIITEREKENVKLDMHSLPGSSSSASFFSLPSSSFSGQNNNRYSYFLQESSLIIAYCTVHAINFSRQHEKKR